MAKKVLKLCISLLIFEHHEKNFRSSLLTLIGLIKPKKQSHATVTLKGPFKHSQPLSWLSQATPKAISLPL
jgi:hypothetical protein